MSQFSLFRSTTALIILFFLSAISSSHADTFKHSDVQLNQEGHKDEHGEQKHDQREAHDDHHDEVEKILIQATRSGRIADEQPIRVELINREEIEEKAAMRPGNISMLVAETGGVRMQTTSPALGSANIRLQGLYGRYTQLLADGLPLYGNQAASIGLLQIPPTDLGRIEIIKGSASSLLWFEEPCPPRNYKLMGEIARATSIPIATGERLVSPHEFQNLFAEGGCAFAQPDLGSAGGITACKKISALAEVNYVLMAPHIWGGPIITAAAIQLCANVPNFLIQESIYKSGGFFNEIIVDPFVWENGDFILTDRPGIGCDLNEEGLAKYAV